MKAYIGLGSNLSDRAGYLLAAVRGMMNASLCVARLSAVYETEPLDVTDQPPFLNAVAELIEPLPAPESLLARLLRIEYQLGRTRALPRGPRTIDLDLLLYGDETRDSDFLILPHPRLAERRFVLTPLAELAPDHIHPVRRMAISELLAAVPDQSRVARWNSGGQRSAVSQKATANVQHLTSNL